jgi:hypothetical protein
MLSALAWIGARAQWVLACGVVGALALPGPGGLLAGTVPFWVTLLFGLALTRIDLPAIARRALCPAPAGPEPRPLRGAHGATPAILWAAGEALGLEPRMSRRSSTPAPGRRSARRLPSA